MESIGTSNSDIKNFCVNEHEKMDSTPENIKEIDEIENSSNVLYNIMYNQNTCNDVNAETIDTLDVTNAEFYNQSKDFIDITSKKEEEEQSNISRINGKKSIVIISGASCTQEVHETSKTDDTDNDESLSLNSTMKTRKKSCAFIIDNFSDKETDAEVQAAKYKSMIARFQNRHRRGVSLSKLETQNKLENHDSMSPTSLLTPSTSLNSLTMECNTNKSTPQKVKMRVRDRSNSRVRNVSNRHSWSPQSSTHDLQESRQQHVNNKVLTKAKNTTNHNSKRKTGQQTDRVNVEGLPPKGASSVKDNQSRFTPRSTAMQLALQQMDFMCPQPPLTEFKEMHNVDGDDISETGTYTLDGDNYTEEQKDLMNIDRNTNSSRSKTNKELPSSNVSKRSHNILEVNYYHEADAYEGRNVNHGKCSTKGIISGHSIADAYLEKIKSRVLRNMCANDNSIENRLDIVEKSTAPMEDDEVNSNMGCFTSVTTSGVLAKQRTLDACPKLSRKSGLSTSQIDSSEYVSSNSKLKNCGISSSVGGGFTDYQKAEYRLNVFTNQKDSTTRQMTSSGRHTKDLPAEMSTNSNSSVCLSEVAVLQTAHTKHDWIQEWARNARARSLASDRYKRPLTKQSFNETLMTRSYTYADAEYESVTDDSLCSSNNSDHGHGRTKENSTALNYMLKECLCPSSKVIECNYLSDPSFPISTTKSLRSPSKIPSPLNSLRRKCIDSHCEAVAHQTLPHDEEGQEYLQHTIAAINNLQQSLSRKGSLKSSTHSSSSKTYATRSGVVPLERINTVYSPNRNTGHDNQRSVLCNASLMTNSINEQQLQFLQQMRLRKNSMDDKISHGETSESSSLQKVVKENNQMQTSNYSTSEEDSNATSLKRSSSFNTQKRTNFRPNFKNTYTSPASQKSECKNQYKNAVKMNAIKKSISTNDFDQMSYSDYDNNLQYYVNDEDDVGSIGDGSINAEITQLQKLERTNISENFAPLSTARYNKALLMRIECNKQKATGEVSIPNNRRSKLQSAPINKTSTVATTGVIACPNTPELPRRNIKAVETCSLRNGARRSMPRDSVLNHFAQQVPNSLTVAKNQLLQTAANITSNNRMRSDSKQRTQPRYLDISKYKPAQSNQFLRKNDAKTTLKPLNIDVLRRSPSSSSVSAARSNPTRLSKTPSRSMSSTAPNASYYGESRSSSVRRDTSVSKQKEMEMALWKRRSKYDPLKAVAEDKRKKEEAKRLTLAGQINIVPVPTERGQV